jgi:uncharacterized protein
MDGVPELPVDLVRPLYGGEAAHDFDHALRVLTTAERIARAEGADVGIVRAAALLHDIGREQERREGGDHALIGAARARELLADWPSPAVDAVCHAIACHRFRVQRPPSTVEARVVHDADKLDAIGAIGVARAFAYGGAHGRRLWAEDGSGEHTSRQEFRVKLVRIRERLLTDEARRIAGERHSFMVQFFDRMGDEVLGRA